MLRVLALISTVFLTLNGFATPLAAAQFASLSQPSQTATAERGGVQLIAFYDKRGEVLDLTVLITEPDGEALRTRIGMRDRQHHTLVLPSEDDQQQATRIEFMRTGERIEMMVSSDLDLSDLASDQHAAQF